MRANYTHTVQCEMELHGQSCSHSRQRAGDASLVSSDTSSIAHQRGTRTMTMTNLFTPLITDQRSQQCRYARVVRWDPFLRSFRSSTQWIWVTKYIPLLTLSHCFWYICFSIVPIWLSRYVDVVVDILLFLLLFCCMLLSTSWNIVDVFTIQQNRNKTLSENSHKNGILFRKNLRLISKQYIELNPTSCHIFLFRNRYVKSSPDCNQGLYLGQLSEVF